MFLSILDPLQSYLDRKSICKFRSTCKEVRDAVPKPKSLRHIALKLDTSIFAKIDMTIAACKLRCVKQCGWYYNYADISIGYQSIDTDFIKNNFKNGGTENSVLYFTVKKMLKFEIDKIGYNESIFSYVVLFQYIDLDLINLKRISAYVLDFLTF